MSHSLRFVLFAEPRTGSASLLRCLQAHASLTVLDEPFNHNWVNWGPNNRDYRGGVRDKASLNRTLDDLFEICGGFKVSGYQLGGDDVGGLPRSIEEDLVVHLLSRRDIRFIYLRRRNLLQQVTSGLIAHQTGLWQKWDATAPLETYYGNLDPLDVEDVDRRLSSLTRNLDLWERALEDRDDAWLSLFYEDLYCVGLERQIGQLNAIWEFLGVDPLGASAVEPYLRRSQSKLNSAETYARVPNIELINDRFGSDEYGWLF